MQCNAIRRNTSETETIAGNNSGKDTNDKGDSRGKLVEPILRRGGRPIVVNRPSITTTRAQPPSIAVVAVVAQSLMIFENWLRTLALLIAHSTGVHGSSLVDGILSLIFQPTNTKFGKNSNGLSQKKVVDVRAISRTPLPMALFGFVSKLFIIIIFVLAHFEKIMVIPICVGSSTV